MNQQVTPPQWGHIPAPRSPQGPPTPPYPIYVQEPPRSGSDTFRYVALGCVTVMVLAGVALAAVLLIPRASDQQVAVAPASQPTVVASPPSTVVVPASPAGSGSSGSGGYSCGSTSGHAVYVNNGTVPCNHALEVAQQWLTYGTTPGNGLGPAGTMYSWTCTSTGSDGGYCTSRMGSHLSIGA